VTASASDPHYVFETLRLEAASPVQRVICPLIHHLEMTASELGIAPHQPGAASLAAGHGFRCV
jgi:hypothetical protein